MDDLLAMRRALRLAALGRHASPNPMVGCVIVDRYGDKVGEGWHPAPGQPHAEVYAMRHAGDSAAGGTAYVTLEPCSHHGRTPPCCDAIIDARLSRVVVATVDPDERVAGRGIDKMRQAGIQVDVGLLNKESSCLNSAYIYQRTRALPWVTVKVATTLDGKTATVTNDSKWITSATTRRWVHRQLRDRSDAILVGIGTILTDDPALNTRLQYRDGRNPLRLVIDSKLRTPLDSAVVRQSAADGKTIIFCLAQFAQMHLHNYSRQNVSVVPIDEDENGRVDLMKVMRFLGTRGDVVSVLIEGGSTMIASAFESGIVNRYISTVAPKIVGGAAAPGAVGGDGVASTMERAVAVGRLRSRRSGEDLVIDAHLIG